MGAGTLFLNTADSNTAVGAAALLLNTTGPDNTAVGADALVYNVAGDSNTAVGAEALEFNHGLSSDNTAVGAEALQFNTDGTPNTAIGYAALNNNLIAGGNTAVGYDALLFNDALAHGFPFGWYNNAVGAGALISNGDGYSNNAFGNDALFFNVNGVANTAIGYYTLWNNDSDALGFFLTTLGATPVGLPTGALVNLTLRRSVLAGRPRPTGPLRSSGSVRGIRPPSRPKRNGTQSGPCKKNRNCDRPLANVQLAPGYQPRSLKGSSDEQLALMERESLRLALGGGADYGGSPRPAVAVGTNERSDLADCRRSSSQFNSPRGQNALAATLRSVPQFPSDLDTAPGSGRPPGSPRRSGDVSRHEKFRHVVLDAAVAAGADVDQSETGQPLFHADQQRTVTFDAPVAVKVPKCRIAALDHRTPGFRK